MSPKPADPSPTPPVSDAVEAAAKLRSWFDSHRRVFVLTGAGISTNSGIPDYRGADGQWKGRSPITYQDFVGDPAKRALYWARSFVGWPAVAKAEPNGAHSALVTLEERGLLSTLVTQNVDGLHSRAGHRNVIDLHGRIGVVVCLQCDRRMERAVVQDDLKARYPDWTHHTAVVAPDGDADLDDIDLSVFVAAVCPHCGGILKPDVVFFGENVPREKLARAIDALEQSDAVMVVGSSLMVYSGFRFARMARERGLPLAILTRGITRADDLATLKLDAESETALVSAVGGT